MGCKALLLAMACLVAVGSCRLLSEVSDTKPVICFTFDDQHEGVYHTALPILGFYGYPGTCFVNSNLLGEDEFLSRDQLTELHQTHGWEVGGHSLNHEDLPQLSYEEAAIAIGDDYANLELWGYHPRSFALPRGACPAQYYDIITNYYQNIRGSSDFAMYSPVNRLSLGYLPYQSQWAAKVVNDRILRGISNGECLIIIGFHRIDSSEDTYQGNCREEIFEEIVSFVNSLSLDVLTVSDAVARMAD